jgi:hypothetical protein
MNVGDDGIAACVAQLNSSSTQYDAFTSPAWLRLPSHQLIDWPTKFPLASKYACEAPVRGAAVAENDAAAAMENAVAAIKELSLIRFFPK